MDNYPELKDKKLLAFDLYGTCINHDFDNTKISKELKEILTTTPITMEELKEKNEWNFEITDEMIKKTKKDIESVFLYHEVLETLKYIKSKWYQTAVVSNLSKDYAEPLHRLIPQWNFDYEVLSFDVGANKPDPKSYEYLKSLSWIDFKDIVMIWDSLKSDVLWSHNVWITPIHLNRDEKWIKKVHKKWIDFIQISTLADLKEIF